MIAAPRSIRTAPATSPTMRGTIKAVRCRLAIMRNIERNPVRAAMPFRYPKSRGRQLGISTTQARMGHHEKAD